MKKTLKWTLIGLSTAVAGLLAVVPLALPPIVKCVAEGKFAELGVPAQVWMDLGYTWRNGPELAGTLRLAMPDSSWRTQADFGVGLGEWHAHLRLPQTDFTEADPLVGLLLERHPVKAVSNLSFSASVSLEASVERTRRMPVPVWRAKMPFRAESVSLVRDDKPLSLAGLSATFGASGIADHLDVAPTHLRLRSAVADGFTMTNLTASIRATEKALLVTEAKAGLCGGQVSLFSLFLDPKTLNAGFTVYMDDLDAGDILSHLKGFRGEASGHLHGKLRLFLREGGKSILLRDAFLYSTPGDPGKLKMPDASVVTDNLALAGIDEGTRRNVSNALTDLDYSVLKLELRHQSVDTATLSIRLDGTATRGNLTVPVNLNINFNGKLGQIINTGLGLSDRLKGNKK